MKLSLLFTTFLLTDISVSHANFTDKIAKVFFDQKVSELHTKALSCNPIEKDPKTSLTASEWIKIQPPLPNWKMLTEIENTAKEASRYARSVGGNDKRLHCLVGCYVAKKLDYKSAVLAGWFKELQDASDCSKNTSFEKKDYEATVKGAQALHSQKTCDIFCKKK